MFENNQDLLAQIFAISFSFVPILFKYYKFLEEVLFSFIADFPFVENMSECVFSSLSLIKLPSFSIGPSSIVILTTLLFTYNRFFLNF